MGHKDLGHEVRGHEHNLGASLEGEGNHDVVVADVPEVFHEAYQVALWQSSVVFAGDCGWIH